MGRGSTGGGVHEYSYGLPSFVRAGELARDETAVSCSDTVPNVPCVIPHRTPRQRAALAALSGDEQRILFTQLCNVLDPRLAVALSSVSFDLRTATQEGRQQLRTDHEVAAAFCLKVGLRSCKELHEAKRVDWCNKGLTTTDLGLLGTLGSVLPALEKSVLSDRSAAAGPDGVQQLAEGLGAGALPAVSDLQFIGMHVGDAGASELAAALGRGALPRLEFLGLIDAAIGDTGLVALASALRQRPALDGLNLAGNPFGDEGLAALVAPPLPAGALPPPAGGLAKLETLYLMRTQITDAGCAALASALESGALPALKGMIHLGGIPASAAAQAAVQAVLHQRLPLYDEAGFYQCLQDDYGEDVDSPGSDSEDGGEYE
jgi:hypothetical protein